MKRTILLMICLLTVLLACQFSGSSQTVDVQSSINATLTAMVTAVPTQTPTPQVDTQATANAQASATAFAQASATANAIAAAVTAKAEKAAATLTQAAGVKVTATAAAQNTATAQAQDFTDVVKKLYDQGLVGSLEGEYVRLDDFDESWAKINYFHWFGTDYDLTNFVVRADMWYSSASDKANWFNAGCGFLFGEKDSDNFHRTYVSLDGFANFKKHVGGNNLWVEKKPLGFKLSVPEGQVKLLLAVFNKHVAFFVNDAQMFNTLAPQLQTGELNYVLSSGTNAGYGTRCKMTNIDLWIFK